MNKKVLIKIITGVLLCLCFIVTGDYITQLMGAVYTIVFCEFDHTAFLFVLGVFVFEHVILKRWGSDRRCEYLCLGITIITAVCVLFHGSTNYLERLAPGADTSLIKRSLTDTTIDEDRVHSIFAQYYFTDKNLILSDEKVKGEENHQYIYKMAVPSMDIVVDEAAAISEEEAEKILSYPCKEYNSDLFVVDDAWESTDSIRMTTWEDYYIFCSEELFERAVSASDDEDAFYVGSTPDLYELAENAPYRELKQIAVMLMLLVIGGCDLAAALG